jgi:hypothetical protein
MRFLRAPFAGLFLLLGMVAANATATLHNNPGGFIDKFEARFERLASTGEPIVIDGFCNSACTLVTGMVPRSQVCAMPDAQLGFHSAWEENPNTYSPEGTREMWRHYPPYVRRLIRQAGWSGPSKHPDVVFVDANKIFKECATS